MTFAEHLRDASERIETELRALFTGDAMAGVPDRLVAAMRHAVLAGGKRLRPFLVVESAKLFDLGFEDARPAALAVELVHGYSLVHDDLPAMDNDLLRRGRPTVWKAFDEWTAILAGDGLQALAFEVLANGEPVDEQVRARLILALARASGNAGMVGGQALDLEADKLGLPVAPDAGHIRRLQAMKTGALISFSCEAGAILAGSGAPRSGTPRSSVAHCDPSQHRALHDYGTHLGYAFQIADDILDAEGDEDKVGKAVAKDAAAGKATLVTLIGLDAARHQLSDAVDRAKAALAPFGDRAERLRQAADFVAERDR